MSTRIRYIKDGPGQYISARYVNIKDGEARVILDPFTKSGVIMLSGGRDIRFTGTSLHKLKIRAKEKLIELGAEFDKEERDEKEERYGED